MGPFKLDQLPIECVVILVRNDRPALDVIEPVVFPDFLSQLLYALSIIHGDKRPPKF